MSSLKFLNHFLSSPPLHSPYIKYRFSCPKYRTFISSQFRLFSSATSSISYMELVKEVANKGPESQKNIAIRADEKSYSYLQLLSSARRISNLLSKLDLKTDKGISENEYHSGTRVGIVAKPSAEFVAGILGTWLTGSCAVPLALSYPESELLHVMNDSDISIILSTEDHQELMNTIAAKTGAQLSLIPSIPDVHSSTKHDQSKDMVSDSQEDLLEMNFYGQIMGENPAFILYTSGTTGKPKGVVHTHNGVLAQVQMLANAWEYTAKDQFLHCLPLHHIQIPLFLFPIMLFTFSLLLQCVFVWDKWITISFGLKSRLILNLYYTCAWTFQCFTCPSLCRFHGNYSKIISLLQTFFTYSIHAV